MIQENEVTTDRFVTFIDILGFQNLVDNNTHEQVLKKLENLKQSLDEIDKREKQDLKTWIFSDSILIISKNDTYSAADSILINTSKVVERSLQLGLLVKGAIAQGKFTVDFKKSIFFGKPLINAYLMQEELKLSSIVLHHSFEDKILSFPDSVKLNGAGRCFEYLTPMKLGSVNHLHLNWLEYNILYSLKEKDQKNKVIDHYIKKIREIYLTVSGYSRVYIDNTLSFFEECRKKSINK
ncbi:MAG: hypothetical protein WC947_08130 [Elusimicrobiota bacterium]